MTDGRLRTAIAALALAGAAVAAYLVYARYTGTRLACTTGGCEISDQFVQVRSRFASSKKFVPVAGQLTVTWPSFRLKWSKWGMCQRAIFVEG